MTKKELRKIISDYVNFTNMAVKSQDEVLDEMTKVIYKKIKKGE